MCKKVILLMLGLVSIIGFSSCGTKNDELLRMRDSLQNEMEWKHDLVREYLANCDSLMALPDKKEHYETVQWYLDNSEALQALADKDKEKIFQIDLVLYGKK